MDVDRAVTELKRAAKKGLKGVMLTPWPANGKAYGDTYYDPFWVVAQEYGLPVGLHVIARPNYHGNQWYQNPTFKGSSFYYLSVTLHQPSQALSKSLTVAVLVWIHQALKHGMQLRQVVKRHRRIEMVLKVVIHLLGGEEKS
jgi:hypothetical protein